jgi:hypothetical protein
VVYRSCIVQVREPRKAARLLLDHLDIIEAAVQVPLDRKDVVVDRFRF